MNADAPSAQADIRSIEMEYRDYSSPVLAEVVASAPTPGPELAERLRALLPKPRAATDNAAAQPSDG
jgi:hypothetical protein